MHGDIHGIDLGRMLNSILFMRIAQGFHIALITPRKDPVMRYHVQVVYCNAGIMTERRLSSSVQDVKKTWKILLSTLHILKDVRSHAHWNIFMSPLMLSPSLP